MTRLVILLAASAFLAGCANGYERFYTSLATPAVVAESGLPADGPPHVRISTGDAQADRDAMFTEGYAPVGYASFSGPMQNIRGALTEGKKVGAAIVVVARQYTNTLQGAIPITMPTSQTSFTNRTVSAYGLRAATPAALTTARPPRTDQRRPTCRMPSLDTTSEAVFYTWRSSGQAWEFYLAL